MTLTSLLDRTGVPLWERALWFRGVKLVQDTLMVPDPDIASTLSRCFLPRLRLIYPALAVAFVPGGAAPTQEPPRKPLFKQAYTGKDPVRQGDML